MKIKSYKLSVRTYLFTSPIMTAILKFLMYLQLVCSDPGPTLGPMSIFNLNILDTPKNINEVVELSRDPIFYELCMFKC